MFFTAKMLFGCNVLNANALKCVSMNNQERKISTKVTDNNNNEPSFFLYSVKVNKSSGVSDVAKNINVKVFNLTSTTNETRHIEWHDTFKCRSRLNANVCNNKQRWNKDKCKCECKELIDRGTCNNDCNLSDYDIECDNTFDVGEYLDYKDFKYRNKLVDKLVEECRENIDQNKMIYDKTLNDYGKYWLYNSCTIYTVFFYPLCHCSFFLILKR